VVSSPPTTSRIVPTTCSGTRQENNTSPSSNRTSFQTSIPTSKTSIIVAAATAGRLSFTPSLMWRFENDRGASNCHPAIPISQLDFHVSASGLLPSFEPRM